MKRLMNELEYRKWITEEVFCISNDDSCIFTLEDVEEEILRLLPPRFPCIACIERDLLARPPTVEIIRFITEDEISALTKILYSDDLCAK